MLVRSISSYEKDVYNKTVTHPLQSYEWGEFRRNTGVGLERVGIFDQSKLIQGFEVTFHRVPHTSFTVGYMPKGTMPDEMMLGALQDLGKRHNALFIKLEPNVARDVAHQSAADAITTFLSEHGAVAGRPLFTRYTFILDLKKTEAELMEQMRPKTRYNIGLAQKKDVRIIEDSTERGLEEYLTLLAETTKRQQFYAHGTEYFQTMWKTLGQSGMMHIFKAVYQGKTVTAWVMFVFNKTLYYPYGASSREHRDVMANNLMMWEMIRFGKSQGCTSFDMWGSLGPNPDPKDPWFGFHRFKKDYGGTLTEFVGTYDYVLRPMEYNVFRFVEGWRWKLLRLRSQLGI